MTKSDPSVVHTPFFLRGSAGDIFALHLMPAEKEPPKRGVLMFPPFAEEMNKSRRMISLQARRMVAAGYQVLLIDPYGTGDSEGEFADARWDIWRDDMVRAASWLLDHGVSRMCLWGIRAGALLSLDIAAQFPDAVDRLLLWQPVTKGNAFLTQFLRLRIASEMFSGGEKLTTKTLRTALNGGESQEIAGYMVHPELAQALDSISIDESVALIEVPLGCFQVSSTGALNAAGKRLIESRAPNAADTLVEAMSGEQFWQTAEIAVVDELLDRTTAWLREQS